MKTRALCTSASWCLSPTASACTTFACNLKEAYETEAKNVVKEFEKSVVLQIIDDDWKENLRKLDELKHSVQNASYEQKDPIAHLQVGEC